MEIAGNSRPSSGSEHLFCHSLEENFPEIRIPHGIAVAMGTYAATIFHNGNMEKIRRILHQYNLPVKPSAWNITEENNTLNVAIDGRLVAAVAPALREEIFGRLHAGANVLFDLGNMVHIDSSGLGVLVQVLQKTKSLGGKVVLAALQPGPKIVFDITKVSRVFEIVPTVADAKF